MTHISFLLALVGSIGMIVLSLRFSFSTNVDDLKFAPERLLGLNGVQVWKGSWVCIIWSIIIQYPVYLLG